MFYNDKFHREALARGDAMNPLSCIYGERNYRYGNWRQESGVAAILLWPPDAMFV